MIDVRVSYSNLLIARLDLQQQCTGASLSLLFPPGDPNITRNFSLFPTAITDRVLGQLTPIHQSMFWGSLPASSWVGRPPVLGLVARQFLGWSPLTVYGRVTYD